jgi:hypothetical protein
MNNWIEYLTTNQAVEGSNPSSVTKSKKAQSLQRKLQAFFMPRTTRCLHRSGSGPKKSSRALRGRLWAVLFGIRSRKDLSSAARKILNNNGMVLKMKKPLIMSVAVSLKAIEGFKPRHPSNPSLHGNADPQ